MRRKLPIACCRVGGEAFAAQQYEHQAVAALGIGQGQLTSVELQVQAAGSQLGVWEWDFFQGILIFFSEILSGRDPGSRSDLRAPDRVWGLRHLCG